MLFLERSGLEAALKSVNFTPESDDFNADSIIVGRLALLLMFDILEPSKIGQ